MWLVQELLRYIGLPVYLHKSCGFIQCYEVPRGGAGGVLVLGAVGPVQVEEHILEVEGSNVWTVKFSQ